MAELILIDVASGAERERWKIDPQERYTFYAAFHEGNDVEINGKKYVLKTVAWRIPEEQCVCAVVYHGPMPITAYTDA